MHRSASPTYTCGFWTIQKTVNIRHGDRVHLRVPSTHDEDAHTNYGVERTADTHCLRGARPHSHQLPDGEYPFQPLLAANVLHPIGHVDAGIVTGHQLREAARQHEVAGTRENVAYHPSSPRTEYTPVPDPKRNRRPAAFVS